MICNKCKEEKTKFNLGRKICSDCWNEYQRNYRKISPKHNEAARRYYATHKKERKLKAHLYYIVHKDEILNRCHKYYKENKEAIKKWQKENYQKLKAKI